MIPKRLYIPRSERLLGRLCAVIVILVVSWSILTAQQKTAALKFDMLTVEPDSSYSESRRSVQERINRFVAEAKRQPGKLKYLVYYRARVRQGHYFWKRAESWAEQAKSSIAMSRKTYDASDVLILDAGVRENETLELWFVPRGESPKVKPEFERSEAIDCPHILAYHVGLHFDSSHPVVFHAEAGKGRADGFNWTVSDGRIVGENGRSRLHVDVTNAKTNRITAFLEVKGLPVPCENTAMVTAEFGKTPRLVDSFGVVSNGDLRSRLDAFLATLAQNPELHGYAYIYGERARGKAASVARHRWVANHFRFRNFDRSRITIIEAGYRESASTDLWLVPPGVQPPIPSPTVDTIFVERTKSGRQARRK